MTTANIDALRKQNPKDTFNAIPRNGRMFRYPVEKIIERIVGGLSVSVFYLFDQNDQYVGTCSICGEYREDFLALFFV